MTKMFTGSRAQRLADVGVAAVAILITLPLLGLAALLLRAILPGPAFVREERVGQGGQAFELRRLRTSGKAHPVRPSDSGAGECLVRTFQYLGISALPGLINVLMGQMSIVGPRAAAASEVSGYTPSEIRLTDVRPGLISPAWHGRRRSSEGVPSPAGEGTFGVAADRLVELRYIQRRNIAKDGWVVARAVIGLLIRLAEMLVSFAARVTPWLLADALIVAASVSLAYFLRFLDTPIPAGTSLAALFWTVAAMSMGFAMVNLCFLLHRRAWRYAAGIEVLPIAVATLTSAGIATLFDLLHPGTAARVVPLSVEFFGSFLSGAGFVAFRYRSRIVPALVRLLTPAPKTASQPIRAIVYGAGEIGQILVRRLGTHIDGRGYKVVGFFDDDLRKQGLTIHGIRVVGGRRALRAFVVEEGVDVIVLALGRSTRGANLREILSLAQSTPAQIKVAQDVVNWMGDRYSTALLRDMRPEDLIGRQPTSMDVARCEHLVAGKTMMVTGACGSIGSELIRQIIGLHPAAIVAVDMNESGLYDLAVETKALSAETQLRVIVGDVTNRKRMLEVVAAERPNVIFHVAAYKHVPLMEQYPHEAAWTNVWGSWVMVDAARECGAERFVLVSTDKAVNPSSIMGATKRMAEILVQPPRAADRSGGSDRPLTVTVVRFGNVLGSRGSVIPTFERQIELGGAVTVTHPEMTRYFMHPEEAAALVVEAAGLSQAGDVFMLDMGDRVAIDELARKMIRMRGLRPNVDVAIEYTGLRPGEKLHEELIYSHEERCETAHPRIFQIRSQETSFTLRDRLLRMVRDYAAGTMGREALTAEVVDIATDLIGSPRTAAPQGDKTPKELVGERQPLAAGGVAVQPLELQRTNAGDAPA